MENKHVNNSNELIIFLYKNKKTLFFVGLITGIVSLACTFLFPREYLSNAIVFPAATSTVSFNSQSNAKASSMDLGEEERAEQMIQILQSSPLRNRIIELYDLASVYDIKPGSKGYYHNLNSAYQKNIKFKRTKFGSVDISVLDTDPQRAADIANKIVELIDTFSIQLIKERTIPAYEINKRKWDDLLIENDSINQIMTELAVKGVVNSKSRGELYKALNDSKNKKDRDFFEAKIEINQKYGAQYDALESMMEYRMDNLSEFKASYEQAKSDAFENFSTRFVVEYASPSDLKAKPKRIIIALIATFSALFLTVILLLIKEKTEELKQNN